MKLHGVLFYRVKSRLHDLEVDAYKDMLRYDLAFVNPELPGIVAFPVFNEKNGRLGGVVTAPRWRSFCVVIEPVADDTEHARCHLAFQRADNWTTYQHPSPEFGPTDYGTLHPFSLKRYLEAKDRRDATKVEKST